MAVREIKGSFVGNLVHVRGIVTRVSNVKPMAVVLTLSCDQCGSEVFQEVSLFLYVHFIFYFFFISRIPLFGQSLKKHFLDEKPQKYRLIQIHLHHYRNVLVMIVKRMM